jgi:hypothetical protein
VQTKVGAEEQLRLRDLPLKAHEREFHERVPLTDEQRGRIQLTDEWRYAQLGMLVEAWGFRASHERGHLLSRVEMAQLWWREEYEPIVQALREADAGGAGTETERYMRLAMLRYLLLHTHEWTDEMLERLLGEAQRPGAEADTMVHQFLKELR